MIRTPCLTCTCWFITNPTLFPKLTSGRAQQALGKIKKRIQFNMWLESEGISIQKDWKNWIFPEGVCKSVRNKLLLKIGELWIIDHSLWKQRDLFMLPASDPDDMPPISKELQHEPGLLGKFEIDAHFPLPTTAWDWQKEPLIEL